MASHQGGLSSGWSDIRWPIIIMVSHQGGPSSGCLSSGWSFIWVPLQCNLLLKPQKLPAVFTLCAQLASPKSSAYKASHLAKPGSGTAAVLTCAYTVITCMHILGETTPIFCWVPFFVAHFCNFFNQVFCCWFPMSRDDTDLEECRLPTVVRSVDVGPHFQQHEHRGTLSLKKWTEKNTVIMLGRMQELVSWCLQPSQPWRITSGLNTNFSLQKTNFNLSPSYSFHKSLYHKSFFFFLSLSLSQTTAQIQSTILECKTRKTVHMLWSLFRFHEHSTWEPAASRVTYFILQAYTGRGCKICLSKLPKAHSHCTVSTYVSNSYTNRVVKNVPS